MKYFFRKIRLFFFMKNNVKGDMCRTEELYRALFYILKHPSHLFVKKRVSSELDPVLKNVNMITNIPYYERMYEVTLHG